MNICTPKQDQRLFSRTHGKKEGNDPSTVLFGKTIGVLRMYIDGERRASRCSRVYIDPEKKRSRRHGRADAIP